MYDIISPIYRVKIMEKINFLEEYMNSLSYKETNDGFELTMPFTFFNDEQAGIKLNIKKNAGGWYDIDDNGNTFRYLHNLDVNIVDYKDRIEIICSLFSLRIEDELLKGVIGFGTNQTYKQLHNFLQGLSHLSTIKYFD